MMRSEHFSLNETIAADSSVRYAVTFEKKPYRTSGMTLVASVHKKVGGHVYSTGSHSENFTNNLFSGNGDYAGLTGIIPSTNGQNSESFIGMVFDKDLTLKIDDFYLSEWIN